MVFSSALFLLYFLPAFLLLYFLAPSKWKNAVILLGSMVFYAWGAPRFILVLVASSYLDHILSISLSKQDSKTRKKLIVGTGIAFNVALLLYFKYANFFVENVNDALQSMGASELGWKEILLPIGISFFTFQKLSFLVDCYRGEAKPMDRFSNYLLFVALFPQLIAGPIVRFKEIAAQIESKRTNTGLDPVFNGSFRFIIGLSKKVLIANTLGQSADLIMNLPPDQLTFYISWIGIIAYSFQIYFDFSGYSDMAIGLCTIMGFNIPENFNYPYIAKNITEFWRRWHMSLSRWMKDYLYIPLGGNRLGYTRMYFNLWIVFLISGLWHGASWNFVIWGAIHGSFLVLERIIRPKMSLLYLRIPRIVISFFIVTVAWVFFRIEDLSIAVQYTASLFSFNPEQTYLDLISRKFIFVFGIAALLSFVPITGNLKSVFSDGNILIRGPLAIILLILSLAEILAGNFNPFIYFRF